MSSRLFQEVREKRGLCYSIYAFHWGFADTGIFGVHAATGQSDVAELMPVIARRARARGRTTSTRRKLKRARAQLRAGLLMTLESPAARAGQIARQLLLFGRHHPGRGAGRRGSRRSRVDDVRDLAARIFTGSTPTLAAVGPVDGMMGRDRDRASASARELSA